MPVIERVKDYFISQGYQVLPRASLNIAWGQILSDVDLIVARENTLIAVEVKTRHDNLGRVPRQIESLKSYVDFIYLATERRLKKSFDTRVGLLQVRSEGIIEIRKARRIRQRPTFSSLSGLHRICLTRIVDKKSRYVSKLELAQQVYYLGTNPELRECLKEVVTCSRMCETNCPIWKFEFPRV